MIYDKYVPQTVQQPIVYQVFNINQILKSTLFTLHMARRTFAKRKKKALERELGEKD